MEHRDNNPYGENIFQAYNSDPEWVMKPMDSVKAWSVIFSKYYSKLKFKFTYYLFELKLKFTYYLLFR